MRYIRVLEPAAVFREMAEDDVWADDAVHPTAAAYRQIAVSTARMAEGALSVPISSGKRQRTDDTSDAEGETSQRGGGWQPLGGGRYLRYDSQDGDGGGNSGGSGSGDSAAGRRSGSRQEVEVIDEYGGGGSGGGGVGGYGGSWPRGRAWNHRGRGYGGGGRRPRRM
jgi:hypothetical protein